MKKALIVSVGWALCLNSINGQEYQGAEAVLNAIAEASGQESKPAKKQNAVTALQAELIKFREQAKTMPPAEAANKWVAFLEAYLMIPEEVFYQDSDPEDRLTINSLLMALPPSHAWDDIKAQLTERSKKDGKIANQALEVFANVLAGDAAAVNQTILNIKDALKKQKNLDNYQKRAFSQSLSQIQQALASFNGDVSQQITIFKEQLEELEQNVSQNNVSQATLLCPP